MSIRGTVTFECDTKGCRAEVVVDATGDASLMMFKSGVVAQVFAAGWVIDEDGGLHCEQCCEEVRDRDEDDGRTYDDPRDELDRRRN